MFKLLFGVYRRSPFFVRNFIGRLGRLLGLALRPISVIRIGDYKMAVDFTDNACFKYAADRDHYEAAEIGTFLRAIEALGDCVVLDLGANYGAYTLAAANLAKGSAADIQVLAIEPDRRAFRALSRSISLNGFDGVCRALPVIAGASDGESTLFVNARSSADNRTHAVSTSQILVREQYSVRVAPLDALLAENHPQRPESLVVKMDIQGNEPRAFYGMEDTLRSAKSCLIMFEHAPYLIESAGLDLQEFADWVANLDFDSAFEFTRDERVVRFPDRPSFLGALTDVAADPTYRGEAPVTNFLLVRGIAESELSFIVDGRSA